MEKLQRRYLSQVKYCMWTASGKLCQQQRYCGMSIYGYMVCAIAHFSQCYQIAGISRPVFPVPCLENWGGCIG